MKDKKQPPESLRHIIRESTVLTAEGCRELEESDFGLPRERKFPMPDTARVRAA